MVFIPLAVKVEVQAAVAAVVELQENLPVPIGVVAVVEFSLAQVALVELEILEQVVLVALVMRRVTLALTVAVSAVAVGVLPALQVVTVLAAQAVKLLH
jgi:hypothetical protein